MERTYLPAHIRRQVRERARGRCEYCRSQLAYSPDPFVVEHIVPLVHGGTNDLANLACACGGCNGIKYAAIAAYDALTQTTVPLFHPREQNWHEHFTWSPDYTHILGLTATGRATLDRLQLNRANVVNLRRVLRLAGEHP